MGMDTREHHIFAALPATEGLGATVARSLAQARRPLAAAGYGPAVLGPVATGGLHVDETILGRAAAGLGGFFAQAPERARVFARKLQGPVGRLVLPVLPYDSYYPALWRHLAQRRAVEDFDTLAPELAAQARGWPDLVAGLIAALNPREVVILPAPVQAEDVLAALVPEIALSPRPGAVRDVPDTALAMLQRLYRAGATVPPQQLARLVAFHARQPQPAPLAAFSPLDSGLLRRRFRQDLARITALPGVRLGAAQGFAIAAE